MVDIEQIRQVISDLDQIDRDLDLLKKRLRLVKRDLLIASGERKPVVQRINEYTTPDGKKHDLAKYKARFK